MLLSWIPLRDILTVLVALVVISIGYFKWNYTHWKRKNIPYIEGRIPFGSLPNPLTRKLPIYRIFKDFRDHFKALGLKHGGAYVFSNPVYIPVDAEYVKNILSTDFPHFTDRGFYYNERDDPLSTHLFSLGGAKWQSLRQKLTPTFSSGKMKMMFSTLLESSTQMKDAVDNLIAAKEPLQIKEISGRYTTDVIGSCAFGLECNSFKDPDAEFRRYGRRTIEPNRWRGILASLAFNFPSVFKALRIRVTPKDITDFFTNTVKNTVAYREENNVVRKDFLQLLIELRKQSFITETELISQCFIFFFAGFETSSSTMTFCLYELAQNPDIQEKTRKEIQTVLAKYDGEITYEGIKEMKYLAQVLDETLRKYPVVPALPRTVTKDYKIPDEDVTLEKGTTVWISLTSLHYDSDYFPEPEKFDPERFNEENRPKIPPFAYIPFGNGPRICIGMRIGLLQTKVGLVTLLRNYKFTVNKSQVSPLEYDPVCFILTAKEAVLLDAEKLS